MRRPKREESAMSGDQLQHQRVFNFSAGPAAMPLEVLQASAQALVDYQGTGTGIAEVSHRGPEFDGVRREAEARCRQLLDIPDEYAVLFLQGGATQQFELIPMNLLRGRADYLISGQWAKKAYQASQGYGQVRELATSAADNFDHLPSDWQPDPAADYLHLCSNNTIFGTRFVDFPEHPCLIADMSSEIMSRPLDVRRFGLIYAGAQKNLGPSGVVLLIIRKDLFDRIPAEVPPIFNYQIHAEQDSCLNTPPTFGIYVLLETFRWLERQGGLTAMAEANARKAELLYQAIDDSDGFYVGTVREASQRSHMNVTFRLREDARTADFLAEAKARGLVALKGYRSVGGIRASIYNAMPLAGVKALVGLMDDFRRQA